MATTNPFLTPLIQQVVPDALRMKDKLTHASVAQARYNSIFTPTTGASNYSAGGSGTKIMTLRLVGSDYADLSTLNLSLAVAPQFVSGQTNTNAALEDGVAQLINQVTIRIGGVAVETITDFGSVFSALVATTMPREVYEQDGPAQGLYKSSSQFGGSNTYALVSTWFDATRQQNARQAANSWLVGNNYNGSQGRYYTIPLGWLFAGFSQYFPLRNVSNIEIEFLLQSNLNSCIVNSYNAGGAADTNLAGLTINNVEARCDMVRCSPELYQLIDNEVNMGSGITMCMDLHTNVPFSVNAGSVTAVTEKALQTAQSVRFLKSVAVTTRLTNDLTSSAASKSKFGNHAFASFRVLANGVSYPQVQLQKMWDTFTEMKKANYKLNNIGGDLITGWVEWAGPLPVTGNYATAGSSAFIPNVATLPAGIYDGNWWGSAPMDDSRFVPTTSFETFLTSQASDLDGLNLAESAGSQLEVRIVNSPASVSWSAATNQYTGTPTAQNATINVILHHSGVLSIRAGSVEFVR
jgi:hypothetical protein